jgi:hypothetical protein
MSCFINWWQHLTWSHSAALLVIVVVMLIIVIRHAGSAEPRNRRTK